MTKSALRQEFKEKRALLSQSQIQQSGVQIIEQLKGTGFLGKSVFHIFVPIAENHEINTFPIINFLFEADRQVVVPKIENNQMLSCQIEQDVKWQKGRFGVPEPKKYKLIENNKIEIVFVPMFICDTTGNRIGYGGGYYDRFLAELNPECIKIGLNFFEPVPKIDGIESTDVPLNYLVTPDGIFSFDS